MIHHRYRILVALLCSPALWATGVWAAIPSSIKQSTSPAVIDSTLQPFIAGEIMRLRGKSAAAQKAAKDTLIAECVGHGDVTATPEYQTAYARQLNQQLMGLTRDGSIRVRLSAGIIAAQVAEQADKTDAPAEFQPLAMALLKDKDNAVLLWGVKLAKFVVGDLAQSGKAIDGIDKAVLAVVQDHPDSGYIAEEAYSGLTLEPYQNTDGFTKAAPVVLPDLLKLMDARTAQYANGVPGSPQAEEKATVFLAVSGFPAAAAPKVRNEVLASLGKAACAVLNQIGNGNATPELVSVARAEGGALQVFGNNFGNAGLAAAGQAIAAVNATTPANTLTAECNTLIKELKAMHVPMSLDAAGGAAASSPDVQPVSDQTARSGK